MMKNACQLTLILTPKIANELAIAGTLQHIMWQMTTAIIVFRTFISVRDNLAPVVAAVACC